MRPLQRCSNDHRFTVSQRIHDACKKSFAGEMPAKMLQSGFTNAEIKNPSGQKINGHDTYEAEVCGKYRAKTV
jgi:hypothetical protein